MHRPNTGTAGAFENREGRTMLFPMNLQLFSPDPPADPPADPPVDPPADPPLPKSKEELDAFLQRESDRRVTEALKKQQAKLEAELKAKFEAERSEAEKLAKMSAEERAKAELEKQKAELERERSTFARERLELETVKELAKRELPTELAKFVMGETAEATTENLKVFEGLFRSGIEKAVEARLKGKTPGAGDQSQTIDNEALDKMSPEEYAAWREKSFKK